MQIVKLERIVSAVRLPSATSALRFRVNADGKATLDVVPDTRALDGWPSPPVRRVKQRRGKPIPPRYNTGIAARNGITYTDEEEKALRRSWAAAKQDPMGKYFLARCFYD